MPADHPTTPTTTATTNTAAAAALAATTSPARHRVHRGRRVIKQALRRLPAALHGLEGRSIYLAVAAAHPEALAGQACVWTAPDAEYGAYEAPNGEILVCTPAAADRLWDTTPAHKHCTIILLCGRALTNLRSALVLMNHA